MAKNSQAQGAEPANTIVTLSDRGKSWVSVAHEQANWNDSTPLATNNANCETPDDYYDVLVTAKDEAGNTGTKTQRVMLDNSLQTVVAAIEEKIDEFNWRVAVTGFQYTANSTVKLYQVSGDLPEGAKISDYGTLLATAPTDANGTIIPLNVVVSANSSFRIVGDYHGGDNKYQSRLDGISSLLEPYVEDGEQGAGSVSPGGLGGPGDSSQRVIRDVPGARLPPRQLPPPRGESVVLHGAPVRERIANFAPPLIVAPQVPDPLALPGDLRS